MMSRSFSDRDVTIKRVLTANVIMKLRIPILIYEQPITTFRGGSAVTIHWSPFICDLSMITVLIVTQLSQNDAIQVTSLRATAKEPIMEWNLVHLACSEINMLWLAQLYCTNYTVCPMHSYVQPNIMNNLNLKAGYVITDDIRWELVTGHCSTVTIVVLKLNLSSMTYHTPMVIPLLTRSLLGRTITAIDRVLCMIAGW